LLRQIQAHEDPQRVSGPAFALRQALRSYGLADLRADLLAALVVGVVALPLSMALAVAVGVPPQYGLYTAIVAGSVIAALGGSKVQVSGPTAAFVVLLAPVVLKFGLGGLLVASMLAGCMQLLAGMSRMGKLIEFIPYPVTMGFTAGIALVIATLQVKDLLGLPVLTMPAHYHERVAELVRSLPRLSPADATIGALTLLLLLVAPRVTRAVPAPIVGLPLAAVVAYFLPDFLPGWHVETILSRFPETGGVPRSLPAFAWPWMQAGAAGEAFAYTLDVPAFRGLLGSAFAIAILGAIESLLSAVIADGMTGKRHDPDAELVAQGVGNVVAPFFGGFAATGAIARTATNIRAGARSPIAAIAHAAFILVIMVSCAPLLGHLPMASMAALLLIVAWNMCEARHVAHVLRVAPASDVLVLVTCFGLTVLFDMVMAVSVGVVLAAILFMKRMAEVAEVKLVGDRHPALDAPLPPGVVLYQVAGPLFFGAAQKAMSALGQIHAAVRVVILDLSASPHMDATALVALESVLDKLHRQHVFVVIAGVQDQPLRLMARAGWKHRDWVVIWRSFDDAVMLAKTLAASDFAASEPARSAVGGPV
jgi:SulP family sulfate permease